LNNIPISVAILNLLEKKSDNWLKKDAYAYAHKNGCNIRNNKRFFCIT
jgi:hypothetical protein